MAEITGKPIHFPGAGYEAPVMRNDGSKVDGQSAEGRALIEEAASFIFGAMAHAYGRRKSSLARRTIDRIGQTEIQDLPTF